MFALLLSVTQLTQLKKFLCTCKQDHNNINSSLLNHTFFCWLIKPPIFVYNSLKKKLFILTVRKPFCISWMGNISLIYMARYLHLYLSCDWYISIYWHTKYQHFEHHLNMSKQRQPSKAGIWLYCKGYLLGCKPVDW